jgi:spore germination cell wall hydrolase CwlJ-like protein
MKKVLMALAVLLSTPAYADEATCLADNMYWEARNQSRAAQIATSFVVMNRVNDARFPNTICEVVHQGPTRRSWKDPLVTYPIKNRCQFSWYCDGKSDEIPEIDKDLYDEIKGMAFTFILKYDDLIDFTDGATHYHAYYVSPAWAKTKTRTAKIEDHIFYRWENAN